MVLDLIEGLRLGCSLDPRNLGSPLEDLVTHPPETRKKGVRSNAFIAVPYSIDCVSLYLTAPVTVNTVNTVNF